MWKPQTILFENADGSQTAEQVSLKSLDFGKAMGGLAIVIAIPLVLWVGFVILKNR